jgi:hypothetical protein
MNIIVNKQKFIDQLMSGKTVGRTCSDMGETVLNYAEMQSLASGDPKIKEKIQLDMEVADLRILRNGFREEHFKLENTVIACESELNNTVARIEKAVSDCQKANFNEKLTIEICGEIFSERKDTGEKLDEIINKLLRKARNTRDSAAEIVGTIGDFELIIKCKLNEGILFGSSISAEIKGNLSYFVELEDDNALGNISRLENAFEKIPKRLSSLENKLDKLNVDIQSAKKELKKTFSKEEEYQQKTARLEELNIIFMIQDDIIAEIIDDDTENYEKVGTNTTNSENSAEKDLSSGISTTNSENSAEEKTKNKKKNGYSSG